ncbi:Potassium/sodium hyperpolarization-activated cyclic nucleotide-gated channel 4 [Blyttiomyces sp. JEL0837]|nr:Potassium/sodium hyperpolarization-activated cyclic nucleotide-gated channel 4 [Blyttiomyces sp. JEL0837]
MLPIRCVTTFADFRTGAKMGGGKISMEINVVVTEYIKRWALLDFIFRLFSLLNLFAGARIILSGDTWLNDVARLMRVRYNVNSNILRTCIRNWIDLSDNIDRNLPIIDRYTTGFYNSAAEMLSSGFGSEAPLTTRQRWFTVMNMIVSAMSLALLVGNVTTVMTGLDSSGRMFKEKIDEVQQYILYKDLDYDLKRRILSYFEFKYSKGKLFDEGRILTELNQPLRKQISLHNCKSLILKVPFFRDAGDAFISNVVTILKINHFLPGDLVIEEDTSGDEMYFIASGIVEVLTGKSVRTKLWPGLFFGEISLLFGRLKRTATIRTVTSCILYSLSKRDLDDVLLHHPSMANRIRAVAEERLSQLKALRRAERESARLKEALERVGGMAGPSLPTTTPPMTTSMVQGSGRQWSTSQGNGNDFTGGTNNNGAGGDFESSQLQAAAMVAKEVQRALAMQVKSSGYAGGGGAGSPMSNMNMGGGGSNSGNNSNNNQRVDWGGGGNHGRGIDDILDEEEEMEELNSNGGFSTHTMILDERELVSPTPGTHTRQGSRVPGQY